MDTIKVALDWRNHGVSTIPVQPGGKRPLLSWKRWQLHLPPIPILHAWFAGHDCNLAVVTGRGLVVLDFDDVAAFVRWRRDYPKAAATYLVETGRGMHAYFRVRQTTSTMLGCSPGLDVKAAGGCCVAPPSVHATGKRYEVFQDKPILELASLADALWLENSVYDKGEGGDAVGSQPGSAPFLYTELSSQNARQDLIGEIQRAMPVVSLLARFTRPIPSSPDGRWWIMRCPSPLHEDRNPSFWADARHERCSCFKPSCKASQPGGRTMDIINLYGWLHGVSNRRAILELAEELSL